MRRRDADRSDGTAARAGATIALARRASPRLAAAGALLCACTTLGAQEEPIDCTIPRVDDFIESCAVVRRASEFPDCLRAEDIERHSCVVMDADLAFCPDEPPMAITAFFDEPGRTLDCAGGAIVHGGRENRNTPFVRFREDRSLSDITVRRCEMRGEGRAIAIRMIRFFGGELGGDGELGANEPLPLGHHDIRFEDLTILGGGTGIYIGNFSRDVTVERVTIDGTARIAIYSEAGTHRLTIADSVIGNNLSREALAIDSTYDSEIRDTLFVDNREGAINVYHNCGELKGIVCPVVRPTPPNGNRFVGNRFVSNGVAGIQIASRQGRRHSLGWCAALDGKRGRHRDTAEDNTVADNLFVCDEGTAMVLMDGPNEVRGNRVVARGECVPFEISTGGLGARDAQRLDGLRLEGNRIDARRPPRLRNVGAGVTLID